MSHRETEQSDQRKRGTPTIQRSRSRALARRTSCTKALAARHLVEALLIRRDAPYLVVGQRRSLVAGGFLHRIEPIDFALKAHRIAGGVLVGVPLGRFEKAYGPYSRRALDQRKERLIGRQD